MVKQLELLTPWLSWPWWYKREESETKLFHECALALIRANSKEILNEEDIENYILANCGFNPDDEYWRGKAKHFASSLTGISEFMVNTGL